MRKFLQGLLEQVKTYPLTIDLQNLTHPTLIDQFLRNHEAYVANGSLLDEEVVASLRQLRLFTAFV